MANAYNPDGTLNADNILGNVGNWWNTVNKPLNLQPTTGVMPSDWRTAGQLQSNPMNLLGGTMGGARGVNATPQGGGTGGASTLDEYKYQQDLNAATEQPAGMSQEEIVAWLLGGSGGGGGGVNTSGYKELLKDIQARKTALKKRYKTNKSDIEALYTGAATAREADRVALDKSVTAQLEADLTASTEQAQATRDAETARLATTNEARAALGAATPTADLASATVEGGLSRLAEQNKTTRADIATNQSIGQQQLQSEKSGYTSAQELASRALSGSYEDALAGLASEKASIKGQIAQAIASARGSSGPSVNEKIAALTAAQELTGGSAKLDTSNPTSVIEYFTQKSGKNLTPAANAIYAGLSQYGTDPASGKLMDPTTLYNKIAATNSAVSADPNFSITLIRTLLQGK